MQILDVHCEGEVGRVVMLGNPAIPGDTLAAKLHHINHTDDRLRRTLTREPRSAPAGSTNLLFPPTGQHADIGFIVLQPDQAHAMSGSNAICVVTALLESGRQTMHEPLTALTLETAAGLVATRASCNNGKCTRVSLNMTPAFVESLDMPLDTPDWGQIKTDICFGGVFYALIDVGQIGLRIKPGNARLLAQAGMKIKTLITAAMPVQHPEIPTIAGIAYVMFRDLDSDGATRTCTTLWPGRLDRSPCGTGSSAHLATLFARGKIAVGEQLITRSIIGSEFRVRLLGTTTVAGRQAVLPNISGRAWLYGRHDLWTDPGDPFAQGFMLGDTWGPMASTVRRGTGTT